MRSNGAIITLFFVSATVGILSLISYQAASARCTPEDIENGVYCGPSQYVQPPQIGNSGTALIANTFGSFLMPIITISVAGGGAAVFFFAKTKRIATKNYSIQFFEQT